MRGHKCKTALLFWFSTRRADFGYSTINAHFQSSHSMHRAGASTFAAIADGTHRWNSTELGDQKAHYMHKDYTDTGVAAGADFSRVLQHAVDSWIWQRPSIDDPVSSTSLSLNDTLLLPRVLVKACLYKLSLRALYRHAIVFVR